MDKRLWLQTPYRYRTSAMSLITFLKYSIAPQKEIKSIKPENFSVSERMSALESLVGIVHSETPMLAEKYAKEERLAKQ